MKGKFSQTLFARERNQQTAEPLEPGNEREYSKKYGNKQAGRLQHAIEREAQQVLDEIHGYPPAYLDDLSDDEESETDTIRIGR